RGRRSATDADRWTALRARSPQDLTRSPVVRGEGLELGDGAVGGDVARDLGGEAGGGAGGGPPPQGGGEGPAGRGGPGGARGRDGGSRRPAPDSRTRTALSGWSRPSGMQRSGRPWASAFITVP